MGRVNGITTTKDNATQTLLSSVTYRPFGPEQMLTFGNGQTYTRSFDQDGRLASYTTPSTTLALGYDPASQIASIADTGNPSNAISLSYDAVSRLTAFVAPGVNDAFAYDAVGNRTSETIGLLNYGATYAPTSNQIATTAGPTPETFSFDANGSIVNDTVKSLGYDARGRMNQMTNSGGTSLYVVNSLGQRVQKTVAGVTTVFQYDSAGRLIAESDPLGNVQVEYAYVNSIPLAVFK
jgi:YD repeat-containing protein